MTFDKIPSPLPSQSQAIWRLLATMTRWENLDSGVAATRVYEAGRQLNLASVIGAPPFFQEHPAQLRTFVQALATLRAAPRSIRLLALQGALEVAIASGTLPLAQNHALRTVVDALNLELGDLAAFMFERTGADLPMPWDPSLKAAWDVREAVGFTASGGWDDAGQVMPPAQMAGGRIARIKALAMLGLDEGAQEAEIKRAFYRISRVHHPDHYESQGPDAAQEADLAFRRLKDAYEFLLKAKP